MRVGGLRWVVVGWARLGRGTVLWGSSDRTYILGKEMSNNYCESERSPMDMPCIPCCP